MKTFVLLISQRFPAYHPRKGEPTRFLEMLTDDSNRKIHTLRRNCVLWEQRIREINEGKAVLSVRYWSGKPYRTPQVELMRLTGNEVGFQKIQIDPAFGFFIDDYDSNLQTPELAKNDGLSVPDFIRWFNNDFDEPIAIIHFTSHRYLNSKTEP